jgi:hypothetical protein
LKSFVSTKVRFVVVGAHALAALGRPRNTDDLDLFVDASKANAKRIARAFEAFGFPAYAREASHFAEPKRMLRLGKPPFQVDVTNHIDGVSFREAWAGKTTAKVAGLRIHFLGEREFRRNKAAAGRPKDLLDLALLDEGG